LRVFSAIVLSVLLGSCTPSPSLIDEIRALGELRVVTRNSPTTFYYGANERYGIEYELAQAFADHLGVRLSLYSTDELWELIPEVTEKRAHVAAAGLVVTEPRRRLVDFGPSYQSVSAELIYRMGENRPKSLAELIIGKLEVQASASHVGMLQDALDAVPDLSWIENRASNAEALMRRVADGEIDYAVVNSNEFNLLRHYYPEVSVAFTLESGGELAWALPRGAKRLREEVGAFFAQIEATGELKAILDRYYDAARDFDFVGSRAFVRHLHERLPGLRTTFQEAELETGIDWRLLAAIAYQESHWDPNAVSPTGVKGLMMLTARTAKMMQIEDRSDPRQSILGGARYLARVIEKFPERIAYEDRLLMAVASYNIGFGHVEDARIITESHDADHDSWEDVREFLPLLADESWYPHLKRGYAQGSVPVQYVENVRRYQALLEWMTGSAIMSAVGAQRKQGSKKGSDPFSDEKGV
jgi:membrane-bound lytic murein transglycosylase F